MTYLLVFIGGGIGAAVRQAVDRGALVLLGVSLPFGTLLVNVPGSFAPFAGMAAARSLG
ncbi:MAG TPA: hypothetical protein VEZ70_07390 [Allosphingosinicella sp.]|nr:hypothetical protein [Allosphingosinicella sp.]